MPHPCRCIAIIGVSGNGQQMVHQILTALPLLNGSIILVQHMPQYINESVARSLRRSTGLETRIAGNGDVLENGVVYVAPSDRHLRLVDNAVISLAAGEKVSNARPSIDVAMQSLINDGKTRLAGIIFPGIGDDGLAGIRHIRSIGGTVYTMGAEQGRTGNGGKDGDGCALSASDIRDRLISFMGEGGEGACSLRQPCNLAVIGSSTGGPKTLKTLMYDMPRLDGSIVIVQHMPKAINESVRRTLDGVTDMQVKIAENGEEIRAGCAYIAPSDLHLRLQENRILSLSADKRVNFCCPSIDVTMQSLLRNRDYDIVGVILTGMGKDGAAGIRHIKRIGGITMAQDQRSSVIAAMPQAAVETGCVDLVQSPERIGRQLAELFGLSA